MLLKILKEIPDNREKKGRQYKNWAVLFIAILAINWLLVSNLSRKPLLVFVNRIVYTTKKI